MKSYKIQIKRKNENWVYILINEHLSNEMPRQEAIRQCKLSVKEFNAFCGRVLEHATVVYEYERG